MTTEQLDLFAAGEDDVPATFTARPAAPRPAPNPAVRPPAPRPTVAEALFDAPKAAPTLPSVQARVPQLNRPLAWMARNPREAGQNLGEAVADAWHSASNSPHRIDIPLSIVAALALFPIKGHTADVTRIITNCTDWELIQGYREIYAATWSRRPDLAARMAPLMAWLTEDATREKELIYPVRRVTDTAIRYGIFEMTGDPDPYLRADTDLMSWTITSLRSKGARDGLGEFHTPPEVCDMMAAVTMGEPPRKGAWFDEPAGGTGGMFRAMAQRLRHMDLDPADYGWSLTDLDELAAAGAAVNAIVWGLGPNVLISCGNTLADPELPQKTARERAHLIEERDELVGRLAVTAAYVEAVTLADRLMAGAHA